MNHKIGCQIAQLKEQLFKKINKEISIYQLHQNQIENQALADLYQINNFMQSFNNRLDLSQNSRLQVSRLFYSNTPLPSINATKSLEFVPFLQQRDHLGKLLSSQHSQNYGISTFRSLAESKLIDEELRRAQNKQELKVNKVVQNFFKKIDIESRELARSKFVPKKIVILSERGIQRRESNEATYDITSALDIIKEKKKQFVIKQERKSQEKQRVAELKQKGAHSKLGLARSQSMKQKKRNEQIQVRSPKKRDTQNEQKRSKSLIGSLKVKLNPEQIDYKRYKQQKQASLKIFEDYEIGHEKFRQKMKQSKQIAYNIKKELQLD